MKQWDIWLDGEVKMSKQERVVCAAVKFTDNGGRSDISSVAVCVYYSDEKLNDIRSDNLAYGIIATETKGFITNKNRFVDPKEAMKIAVAASQVKNDFMLMSDPPQYRNLKPEDLY